MNTLALTIGYVYPISNSQDWKARHTFKFWHTLQLKNVTKNENNRYSVTLVSDEEPFEGYKREDGCFGNRHPSSEFLDLYCVRNGNEYTFPDAQCIDFNCSL